MEELGEPFDLPYPKQPESSAYEEGCQRLLSLSRSHVCVQTGRLAMWQGYRRAMISTVSELLAVFTCKEQGDLLAGLITLRKQWNIHEIVAMERITEEMKLFTPLLRYAHSEPELPQIFSGLTPLYQVLSVILGHILRRIGCHC